MNLRKATDHSNRDIPVDWKKEMTKKLAKLMPEKNLITTNLATLVIPGVSKSPFADSITTEPKARDLTPSIFKMFEGNLDPVEHIF